MLYNKSPAQINNVVSTTTRTLTTPSSALPDILLQWNNLRVNLIHKIHHCTNLYILQDGTQALTFWRRIFFFNFSTPCI